MVMAMPVNQALKNSGIVKAAYDKDDEKNTSIQLVDNFGYLTIEYYDDEFGELILAESDRTALSDIEVQDIYNNCVNIDGYLETLVKLHNSTNK